MMSALLYIVGAIVFLAGLAAIAFGSPSSALDFGNTLIVAGTTSGVGGLILIGLGAVVSRLQRIADNMSIANTIEHIAPATPAPRPQRPEPRVEPKPFEPRGPSTPPEFPPFMARKPSELARAEPEPKAAASLEPPLSDASAQASDTQQADEPELDTSEPVQPAAELPPKSFFESVWPEEKSHSPEPQPAPERPVPSPPPPREEKPRAVAVLKSGVVDGMGYTLYVDGSIEAELPQGTVRFASIHELREHLGKNG
jgi:hypothetical protein